MTPECTFILPSGQKCRGLAGRSQAFCRHHRPQPAAGHRVRRADRYSPLARWRAVGQDLPWLRPDELPALVYELLDALTQPGQAPSDRTIGRFLRAALTRLGQVPFPYPDSEPAPPLPVAPPFAHAPSALRPPSAQPAHSTHPGFSNAKPGDLAQLQREMQTLFDTLADARQR